MNSVHHGKPSQRVPRQIVSNSDWWSRLRDFMSIERGLTRHRDLVTSLRQQLPWTEVSNSYQFEDLSGKQFSLLDLFTNPSHDDLFLYHMMLPFTPTDPKGCAACSFWIDSVYGVSWALQQKINIAIVAKGTPQQIADHALKRKWDGLPLYSAHKSQFQEDMGAAVTLEEYNEFKSLIKECDGNSKAALEKLRLQNPNHPNVRFNFDTGFTGNFPTLSPMLSVFHIDRSSKKVYRTYAACNRGTEMMNAGYSILDVMPYGREDFWPGSRD